jgi:hypothetical protein
VAGRRGTNGTPKRADWGPRFLAALRKTTCVADAVKAANVGRNTVYHRRETDPAFAEAWQEVMEEACDQLEKTAFRRAKSRSDTLLIFLLKSHRPDTYRETTKVVGGGKGGEIVVVTLGPGQSMGDL